MSKTDETLIEGGGQASFRSSVPIRITKLDDTTRSKLKNLAIDRAQDPDIFDEVEPFFFTARASNQNVDAYWTQMNESSLKNYVADATDPGVQFQNSHNGGSIFGGEVGFGRSLNGKVEGRSGSKEALIDFYVMPGLTCGNMTSDQFILGARSGIYADVSIGFNPGSMICNICGNDWMKRWNWLFSDSDEEETCRHYPGLEYEVGKKKVRCILDVRDGHLNEVSIVYDGATPGAGIAAVDMARMANANGHLSDRERVAIENIYQVRIAPLPATYGGVELDLEKLMTVKHPNRSTTADVSNTDAEAAQSDPQTTDEERAVVLEEEEEQERQEETSVEPMEKLRQKYDALGLRLTSDDPHKTIEALADIVLDQRSKIKTLSREAEYGREARTQLLEELDASTVRAFGATDADKRQARHRAMAEVLDMEGLRSLIDDLEERASSRIGTGGQHVRLRLKDGEETDPETPADEKPRARGQTPAHLV